LQVGAQQPLNSAPAVAVPSADPVASKVSSITTTNENGGVSIRSDEVTGKSSTDGTANSSAGRSSNLSLDALAKAKKALQLKKELSEKLKRLPGVRHYIYCWSFASLFFLYLRNHSKLIFSHAA
jgi:U4/U6 small nuclear ribonucleoprotein PRP3